MPDKKKSFALRECIKKVQFGQCSMCRFIFRVVPLFGALYIHYPFGLVHLLDWVRYYCTIFSSRYKNFHISIVNMFQYCPLHSFLLLHYCLSNMFFGYQFSSYLFKYLIQCNLLSLRILSSAWQKFLKVLMVQYFFIHTP